TIALAVHRVQAARRPSTVSKRLTDGHDAGVRSCVTNKLIGPHVPEPFGLGHDTVTVSEEVGQDLKRFGAEVEPGSSAVQLIALGIQDVVVKEVAHRPVLLVYGGTRRAPWAQRATGIGGPSPRCS